GFGIGGLEDMLDPRALVVANDVTLKLFADALASEVQRIRPEWFGKDDKLLNPLPAGLDGRSQNTIVAAQRAEVDAKRAKERAEKAAKERDEKRAEATRRRMQAVKLITTHCQPQFADLTKALSEAEFVGVRQFIDEFTPDQGMAQALVAHLMPVLPPGSGTEIEPLVKEYVV